MLIRPSKQDDIAALQTVLNETELFPSELLPDMMINFLPEEESLDVWPTCEADGSAIGFCYAVPEALAEGAWNMLAIAVSPAQQGTGCGKAIVSHLENELRKRGQRILIADTSSADEFSKTRKFYHETGYEEEARIRDFWATGEDKIVFWKSLSE